jgi:hypothetical protein
MARVLQTAQRSSRIGRASQDLSQIERWFIKHGVPQFMSGYSPRDNMPVLFYLLLIVVAFDLAIQPWVGADPLLLLVMPATLVSLGLIVKMAIMDQVSYLTSKRVSRVRLAVLSTGIYLISCLVFLIDRDIYWSNFSVNFFVILALLWLSAKLFNSDVWTGDDTKYRERRHLYVLIVGAVICFAFEGSILPSSTVLMDGAVGRIMPTVVPVPQALAALMVTAIIAVQSRSLIPKSSEQGSSISQQQFNVFFPAVPLLVLVFCAETAMLPYVDSVVFAALVPLAILIMVTPLHLLSRRRRERRPRQGTGRWPKRPRWLNALIRHPGVTLFLSNSGVTLFVILYLVACPLAVGTLSASEGDEFSIDAFGDQAVGGSALLLTFGINIFYLGLAGVIAGFGLDRVVVWGIKEAWADWRGRVSNLGRGLSILVVFTTFLLLTAETWETMVEISTGMYLLLLSSLLGLAGAFHLLMSIQALSKKSEFGKWSEVLEAAGRKSPKNNDSPLDPEIKELLNREELKRLPDQTPAPNYPLGRPERINGIIVMMTYEILFFIPAMIIAAIVFLVLGYIAVPPHVAATWVYGDQATDPVGLGNMLAHLPLIERPWLRVAFLLTAFSILYLAVEILSDSDKRSAFFESADNAVRRRLAVRLAYHVVLEEVLTNRLEVLSTRLMAQQAYLEVGRSQRHRGPLERGPKDHSEEASEGRPTDAGDLHQTGT